jgi:hypothetical protein
MSEQIREAPSEAKARAVARPIPEEEPVITAIFPWRRGGIVEGWGVDLLLCVATEMYEVFVAGERGWKEVRTGKIVKSRREAKQRYMYHFPQVTLSKREYLVRGQLMRRSRYILGPSVRVSKQATELRSSPRISHWNGNGSKHLISRPSRPASGVGTRIHSARRSCAFT